MTRDLFVQYAELKKQAQLIDDKLKELQPQILTELADVEDQGVELDGVGTFTVIHRKTWKYSPTTDALAERWKQQKLSEEADGTATYEESRGEMFKQMKKKE